MWRQVFDARKEVFNQDIHMIPQSLLGVTPAACTTGPTNIFYILLTAALKCGTIRWLKPDPPTHSTWIQAVRELKCTRVCL